MTIQHGLMLGIFGTLFTILCFTIAYIVYERHRKNIEQIEADKKKTIPYDFK
jgi:glycerol-3-phosphate acyltransferase PlsY